MRIGVLRKEQSTNDSPSKWVSKPQAQKLVRQGTHYKVSTYVIQEYIKDATPCSSPQRHAQQIYRHLDVVKVKPDVLNPPEGPSTLNLFYPVRDMSSYGPRNFKEIWGATQEEWQQRIGAH